MNNLVKEQESEVVRVIASLIKEGLKRDEIIRRTGVTRYRYDLIARKYNLNARIPWSKNDLEQLIEMRRDGATNKMIAQKLGRTEFSVKTKWCYTNKSKRESVAAKYVNIPLDEEIERFLKRLMASYRVTPPKLKLTIDLVVNDIIRAYNAKA